MLERVALCHVTPLRDSIVQCSTIWLFAIPDVFPDVSRRKEASDTSGTGYPHLGAGARLCTRTVGNLEKGLIWNLEPRFKRAMEEQPTRSIRLKAPAGSARATALA